MTPDDKTQDGWLRQAMPLRTQGLLAGLCFLVVAALAALALLWPGSAPSAASPAQAAGGRMVLSQAQLRGLTIAVVSTHPFRTEVVTDGYIAPGGGSGKADAPILGGQSGDLLQAETDLAAAGGQARLAAANEARQHALYLSEGAALKDWQQSQADLATARAALASARNRLRILGRPDAAIAAVEHGGRAAAPSGFAIRDFSTLWVVANVREADSGMVRIGDPVSVRLAAFPGRTFRATVAYIGAMIDPVTHRLQVGARLDNAGKLLKPNMQATVTLFGADAAQSPAVPSDAVIHEGDDARVWIVGAGDTLMLRQVSVGRQDGGYSEITRGLHTGERVVAGGALFIDSAATAD